MCEHEIIHRLLNLLSKVLNHIHDTDTVVSIADELDDIRAILDRNLDRCS
jgi:hypothetical protein